MFIFQALDGDYHISHEVAAIRKIVDEQNWLHPEISPILYFIVKNSCYCFDCVTIVDDRAKPNHDDDEA